MLEATTANQLHNRMEDQYDLVMVGTKQIVKDPRAWALFLLTPEGEQQLYGRETLSQVVKQVGAAKCGFACLTLETPRGWLFMKEKVRLIRGSIPGGLLAPAASQHVPAAVLNVQVPRGPIQGWLKKMKQGKDWKKRWITLTDSSAVEYRAEPRGGPLGVIPLSSSSLNYRPTKEGGVIVLSRIARGGKPASGRSAEKFGVFLFMAGEGSEMSIDQW